jgi:hypothetical protein
MLLFAMISFFVPIFKTDFFGFNFVGIVSIFITLIVFGYSYRFGLVDFISCLCVLILYYAVISCNSNYLILYNSWFCSILVILFSLYYIADFGKCICLSISITSIMVLCSCSMEIDQFGYSVFNLKIVYDVVLSIIIIYFVRRLILNVFHKRRFCFEKNYINFNSNDFNGCVF